MLLLLFVYLVHVIVKYSGKISWPKEEELAFGRLLESGGVGGAMM